MPEDRTWATFADGGWLLSVRVVPGSSRTEVAGLLGDELRVKVAAPPNDGKANTALLEFLASALGTKTRDLDLVRGRHSRSKLIRVSAPVELPDQWP